MYELYALGKPPLLLAKWDMALFFILSLLYSWIIQKDILKLKNAVWPLLHKAMTPKTDKTNLSFCPDLSLEQFSLLTIKYSEVIWVKMKELPLSKSYCCLKKKKK